MNTVTNLSNRTKNNKNSKIKENDETKRTKIFLKQFLINYFSTCPVWRGVESWKWREGREGREGCRGGGRGAGEGDT